jgi:catechol 2,3-dioxygenase-like lactoylglutathione lyase family enzyme
MSRHLKINSTSKLSWRFDQWSSQMSVKRIVPDIKSKHVDASRQFYVDVLGLEVAMDMGFIVTLVSPSNPTAQVSLLRDDGSSSILPQISIEVADVDDVHSRAVSRGLQIVYPLTNEPWGVRRFFVTDPNGIVINVMCHIGGAKSD